MRAIRDTGKHSLATGILPKGCQLCVKGKKLVLFVTGLCSQHCYFCPVSDKKWSQDVIYANERPVKSFREIADEARLCFAEGAGITGGDPLVKLGRTASYIQKLKKEFGKDFHIHLYTPLNLVNEMTLGRLFKAGLDEIRFHPDLESDRNWRRIEYAKRLPWDVGVEIPAVPGKEAETKKLIDYLDSISICFININELEISDSNSNNLLEKGFAPKNSISYGVRGSEPLAKRLLRNCLKKKLRAHYCTTTLKDRVQMAERIKLRAKSIRQPFDILHEDGMLTRGALYLPELSPGFGYRKRLQGLAEKDRKRLSKKLISLRARILKDLRLEAEYLAVDTNKLRLLTSPGIAEKTKNYLKELGLQPAIVTEYLTWDSFEVELDFL
mgnify:CR=1 FL=1